MKFDNVSSKDANEAKQLLSNIPNSESFHPFFILSLDIHNDEVRNINKALYSSLQNSHVSGIRRSNYLYNGTKLLRISQPLPQYLILHLKRFVFNARYQIFHKNSKHIAFENVLNISNNLIFDKDSDNNNNNKQDIRSKYKYQLRSVIVHHGDFTTHGHYTSFCKRDYIKHENVKNKGKNSKNKHKNASKAKHDESKENKENNSNNNDDENQQ